MFFNPNYEIAEITKIDIPCIAKVYNSNTKFLIDHLGVESITESWAFDEYYEMRKSGFSSCKIVDKQSLVTIGFIDFKLSKDTYLSLIIINNEKRKNGIGKEIVRYFENYVKSKGSTLIMIDVLYDEFTQRFWLNNGFIAVEEIELSWNRKKLRALKMLKFI